MTTEQFISQQKERLSRLEKGEHVFIAVSDSVADMSVRIFEKGIATDASQIGKYNTVDPLYINTAKKSPKKLKGQGKPIGNSKGKTVHDNGEPYKTTYFESYSDFRKKVGRSSDVVNLNLYGNLKLDFENGLVKVDDNNFHLVLKNKTDRNKASGAEEHFKKRIFYPTKEEESELLRVVQFESLRIMKGL